MVSLINAENLKEGEFFCKWMKNRIRNNKNVLGVELGPTGSGKSYRDLRKMEIWYKEYLNRPFPAENICFGLKEVMQRLTYYNKLQDSGKSIKGEAIMFEEAGANLGSLDFQNKIQKMFTYVLQSFRSMNIIIFFNLPYLSMLNKSARMLLHYSSESLGIDFNTEKNKCKLFFHQVNQGTGKIYKKYPKATLNHSIRTIKIFSYSNPSSDIIKIYEDKKRKYLQNMQDDYVTEIEVQEKKKQKERDGVLEKKPLTHPQLEVYNYKMQGLSVEEIAERTQKATGTIKNFISLLRNKGYLQDIRVFPKENTENELKPVILAGTT